MRTIWDYISARAKQALSAQQVMSLVVFSLGVFHVCLTVFFLFLLILPMAALNAVSAALYFFCYMQARKSKRLLLVFNLAYLEIIIYAVVGELLMGIGTGFIFHMVATLPLGYYAAYTFDVKDRRLNPMRYVIFSAAAFLAAQFLIHDIGPLFTYENKRMGRLVYIMNYFAAGIVVVLFLSTLLNQIKCHEAQHRNQNEELEKLSKTDSLTGLANRRSLEERYASARQSELAYAVILGDIDDFKAVNDTYGHNVGDNALKAVADIFKGIVREGDTICRWGGEEFLIFLPGCPFENARQRANEILDNVRKAEVRTEDGAIFHITMTLGVAVSSEAVDFEEAVRKADERLYFGKQNGKNQVV